MTQPIDRETAIALAKEAGAYYAGSTNPGTVYMLSENDIERLCNLAASRTKMPELEPPIYGRELVLQLATDAGCPNGYLASFALHHPEWDWIERLCNLAVEHSRKDAEPGNLLKPPSMAESGDKTVVDMSSLPKFHDDEAVDYLSRAYKLSKQLTDRLSVSPSQRRNTSAIGWCRVGVIGAETLPFTITQVPRVAEIWREQGLEVLEVFTHPPEADKPIDKLTGCACRWDENDNRVLTCVRHQGWLDVVEEWATTAKENQVVIDRLTSKRQETEQNTNGTDYVSDAQFDALILELQSITEEARATDYHDALRKAALFLSLLKSKVHKYANDIVRLDAACTEQHAAYTSAHNRLNEADKLLQQALKTLTYHTKQTRPILQTDAACRAIRTYLENKT